MMLIRNSNSNSVQKRLETLEFGLCVRCHKFSVNSRWGGIVRLARSMSSVQTYGSSEWHRSHHRNPRWGEIAARNHSYIGNFSCGLLRLSYSCTTHEFSMSNSYISNFSCGLLRLSYSCTTREFSMSNKDFSCIPNSSKYKFINLVKGGIIYLTQSLFSVQIDGLCEFGCQRSLHRNSRWGRITSCNLSYSQVRLSYSCSSCELFKSYKDYISTDRYDHQVRPQNKDEYAHEALVRLPLEAKVSARRMEITTATCLTRLSSVRLLGESNKVRVVFYFFKTSFELFLISKCFISFLRLSACVDFNWHISQVLVDHYISYAR